MYELSINSKILRHLKRSNGSLKEDDIYNAYHYFECMCPYSSSSINVNDWHLEHIIPVSMGGPTEAWNCLVVCPMCNLSKGAMHLLDWWDLVYDAKDEYKLEKIFNYIIFHLNKVTDFNYLIDKYKNFDIYDDAYILNNRFSLDVITFLNQLLNHLVMNKQYINGMLNCIKKI